MVSGRLFFSVLLVSMTLGACGTERAVQKDVVMEPALAGTNTNHVEVAPRQRHDVRPSRYSPVFDTLEVPRMKVEASAHPPQEFLARLQEAVIQKLRQERLFANVVAEAESRERGGILTLDGTVVSWDEQPSHGSLEVRLAIVDKGSSCELTDATSQGLLKKAEASHSSTAMDYEIDPLVDGTVAFVLNFMQPTP